jgi:hypothetical protein
MYFSESQVKCLPAIREKPLISYLLYDFEKKIVICPFLSKFIGISTIFKVQARESYFVEFYPG